MLDKNRFSRMSTEDLASVLSQTFRRQRDGTLPDDEATKIAREIEFELTRRYELDRKRRLERERERKDKAEAKPAEPKELL